MRLDRYLNEISMKALQRRYEESKIDIMQYLDTIEKDCSKILRVYQNAGGFLYRGVSEKRDFVEKKGRTGVRKPKDTDIEYHRFFNKFFKEKFGWKVRDGISTTNQWHATSRYGETYIFLPTDRYKFAWSPKYGDLWRDFKFMFVMSPGDISTKKWLEQNQGKFKRAACTYKDKDLEGAIKQQGKTNEVMFKVGKYYLLKFNHGETEDDLRLALDMPPRK
jgi:hypothetical protein